MIEHEVLPVTPEMGREWLDGMAPNRHVDEEHVRELHRAMGNGTFESLNGDALRFGEDGRLADGQHRLLALIRANLTLDFLIVRHITATALASVDTNRRRRTADFLAARGEIKSNVLSPALGWAWLYEKNQWKASAHLPSSPGLLAFLEQIPDLRESVPIAKSLTGLLTPGLGVALHWVFRAHQPERAKEFFEQLALGQNLPASSPIYHLRERLVKERGAKKKLPPLDVLALCVYAWNAYQRQEPMRKLQSWRKDHPFPDVE